MYRKNFVGNDRFWIFSSLVGVALLYLNLVWKATENIDQLTTNSLFAGAIIWLLWRKRNDLEYDSDPVSSFIGLLLLGSILSKTMTLFWFESTLLFSLPLSVAIALALIASGVRGFGQYLQELFFAWFLFFPTGAIGNFIDSIVHITILNAKFATYFLYYLGFNVATQGNQVMISLPQSGAFKAIVDYPCAGVPMILLILKLALIFVAFVPLPKYLQLLIPTFSIILGFFLGVIRVCLLTLFIPEPAQFAYWHGAQGSQIFSTLAIAIFSAFCYLILRQQELKASNES